MVQPTVGHRDLVTTYTPASSWGSSSVGCAGPIPTVSTPMNDYCNTTNPPTVANGLHDFDTTPSPQPTSFNFGDFTYSTSVSNPMNFGSPCSQPGPLDGSSQNLDSPVGTNSPVGSVDSYQSPMLGKTDEGVTSEPEADLSSMINVYLEDPTAAIGMGVGLENSNDADHFHKYSTAADFVDTNQVLTSTNPDSLLNSSASNSAFNNISCEKS